MKWFGRLWKWFLDLWHSEDKTASPQKKEKTPQQIKKKFKLPWRRNKTYKDSIAEAEAILKDLDKALTHSNAYTIVENSRVITEQMKKVVSDAEAYSEAEKAKQQD